MTLPELFALNEKYELLYGELLGKIQKTIQEPGKIYDILKMTADGVLTKRLCMFLPRSSPYNKGELVSFPLRSLQIDLSKYGACIDTRNFIQDEIKPYYEEIIKSFRLADYPGYKIADNCFGAFALSPNVIRCGGVMFVEHKQKANIEYESWVYLIGDEQHKNRPSMKVLA